MAEAVRNYPRLAGEIVDLVGGEKNIQSASHCATRLRLVLNDTPAGAKDKVAALPGVITVVEAGGQFQVVIGSHVGEVHEALMSNANISNNVPASTAHKPSILNRVIATMSAVFAPFVYILAAAGLLQGSLIITRMIWPAFEGTGTDLVLTFISWTPFAFLPIFIAITASKHFKVNTYIAVLCAAAIMNPDWAALAGRIEGGETIDFLGIALNSTTYSSSVLPPLILVWVLSYLERFLNKYLRGVAQALLVPLISVVVMVPVVLLVIGPLSAAGASGVANGYNWLVEIAPAVAAGLIGAFWQVAVIFGVHWGVTPFVLDNFDRFGQDSFQAFQTAAVIAQVGAAFGVFLKTRNKEMRGVSGSAAVTGIFGITEPAIYGVTLRLKRPFLLACIAGAVGAITISFFGSRYYAYAGLPGMLTIVNSVSPDNPNSIIGMVVGCAVAFFGAAALVYFIGFKDVVAENLPTNDLDQARPTDAEQNARFDAALVASNSTGVVASPLEGQVLTLAEVPDEVFSAGVMGSGAAIDPAGHQVFAPFDGKVVSVFPSKHAIGLISTEGVEVLIHVGIDTVQLNGEHFTAHVAEGAEVKQGDLVLEFDAVAIKAEGYSLITPVIITNSGSYTDVVATGAGAVAAGDQLAVAVATASASTADTAAAK
ncbi:beta-glucoside-specific PTS transporter subunit IIABC [Pseudoclavibacter helvolus]|uniref:beta-glucoside-specific PTS transporter subunit IIABC n=1 Tax=Pseudoclavibacter helvolus TaxID=255205 RepID=UPI0009EA86F1|nr:beta-glucoside-specific PTS transporter subunit IIABC [Pseudoclavibacter helvolus]